MNQSNAQKALAYIQSKHPCSPEGQSQRHDDALKAGCACSNFKPISTTEIEWIFNNWINGKPDPQHLRAFKESFDYGKPNPRKTFNISNHKPKYSPPIPFSSISKQLSQLGYSNDEVVTFVKGSNQSHSINVPFNKIKSIHPDFIRVHLNPVQDGRAVENIVAYRNVLIDLDDDTTSADHKISQAKLSSLPIAFAVQTSPTRIQIAVRLNASNLKTAIKQANLALYIAQGENLKPDKAIQLHKTMRLANTTRHDKGFSFKHLEINDLKAPRPHFWKEYVKLPHKYFTRKHIVKNQIWWAEKGPSGRSNCFAINPNNMLSVVSQTAKDHQKDVSSTIQKVCFKEFPQVKLAIKLKRLASSKTAPKELQSKAEEKLACPKLQRSIRAFNKCWRWVDEIVRKEKWVKEIRRAICGLPEGRQFHNNQPYLIQTSPVFVKPKQGSCRWTLDFLRSKLIDPDDNNSIQYWTFLHHLRRQVIRLTTSNFQMRCHAGFIMGDPSIGKSLCLNHLILPMLGGRSAEVWNEVSNINNSFNAQMGEAEVLVCDDTIRPIPLANRQKFESILKSLVGAGNLELERKGTDCITLHNHPASFWGLLNDDESVKGLPTISEGSENKWNIYYFNNSPIEPIEGGYVNQFQKEINAFAHWLLNGNMISDCKKQLANEDIDYQSLFLTNDPNQTEDIKRFGMIVFHNDKGKKQFTADEPATQLLHFIDSLNTSREEWSGTAGEFVEFLLNISDYNKSMQTELSKICEGKINSKMGYMLRTLSKTHPQRVTAGKRTKHGCKWNICFNEDDR